MQRGMNTCRKINHSFKLKYNRKNIYETLKAEDNKFTIIKDSKEWWKMSQRHHEEENIKIAALW